jgi:hypothetical protein
VKPASIDRGDATVQSPSMAGKLQVEYPRTIAAGSLGSVRSLEAGRLPLRTVPVFRERPWQNQEFPTAKVTESAAWEVV